MRTKKSVTWMNYRHHLTLYIGEHILGLDVSCVKAESLLTLFITNVDWLTMLEKLVIDMICVYVWTVGALKPM